MKSINPATGELIKQYAAYSDQQVEQIVAATETAAIAWRRSSFETRANLLLKVAELLRNNKVAYGQLITEEMGKLPQQAELELEKCAWVCEYYADHAERFLQDQWITTDFQKSVISYQPLGIILAIMPWNFPFWQVLRFAVPTLMAGNAVILKHATNVSGCALAIEQLFQQAGMPKQLLSTVLLEHQRVASLIADPRIKAVTLTGSTAAGKAVATIAGQHIKKMVLELGGSDPYLILADADIVKAATICAQSRLNNAGQSCIAAKRFIVVADVYQAFLQQFTTIMANYRIGDPHDQSTQLGPLVSTEQRDNLHQQVLQSIEQGAQCILGGEIPDRIGAYYPPTILTEVTTGMVAYEQELFGPVAVVIKAENEQQAIEIANDTVFGLGAAIFSEDLAKAEAIANHQLQVGNCYINTMVVSDPRLPFGGIKQSGYGRELAAYGLHEFVNIKSICVA